MPLRLFLLSLALVATAAAKDVNVALRTLELTADADANRASATAVDLVFVHDRAALAGLPSRSADWFSRKSALQTQFGSVLEVVSLQVPPGSAVKSVALPERHRHAIAALVFADYLAADGQMVLNISRLRHVTVRLRATGIETTERDATKGP